MTLDLPRFSHLNPEIGKHSKALQKLMSKG
uniref:Uncharacterized protein n=1 Tax=Rhizophora mucronata TaxID=61149 RepID=A0A2P2PMI3_RHIMU